MSNESENISDLFGRVEPLPREIFRRCIEENITSIRLGFSGGSDEGHLDVILSTPEGRVETWKLTQIISHQNIKVLDDMIHDWSAEKYPFGGAGEGTQYGENITYDLVNGSVTTQSWGYQYVESEERNDSMETC